MQSYVWEQFWEQKKQPKVIFHLKLLYVLDNQVVKLLLLGSNQGPSD